MNAVLSMEQRAAQGVNLLYFLPCAACALILHIKNKQIVWRAVWPAALAGSVCAVGGALLAIITTINSNYQRYWSSIIRGVDEGWLPAFMGKRNKRGTPWVLMVRCWLMALIPNLFNLNNGQLVSLASAVTLIPMLNPNWGLLKLHEGDTEGWKATRWSKYVSSNATRLV